MRNISTNGRRPMLRAILVTFIYYWNEVHVAGFGLTSQNTCRVEYATQSQNQNEKKISCRISSSLWSSAKSIEDCLHRSREAHDLEVSIGKKIFGPIRLTNGSNFGDENDKEQERVWTDDDFSYQSIGEGYSGPDQHHIRNAQNIYSTVRPVFTPEECKNLIDEARDYISADLANGSNKERGDESGTRITNSELGEARVSNLPNATKWLRSALQTKLFPLLKSRFGNYDEDDDLVMYDALIIGHIAPTRNQPVHRDASFLTLNIALSPLHGYSGGGGTYFPGLLQPDDNGKDNSGLVQIDQGHVVCHAGGTMHAGNGIQSGERWIMVLFVLSETKPQLARRTHAEGVLAMRRGDLNAAEVAYNAGLTLAPDDHLLVTSLGGVHSARGDMALAEQSLRLSLQLYPICFKAPMALGRMLLARDKPLSALKYFEFVLERIGTSDLRDSAWMSLKALAWDARTIAAYCVILCAERELQRGRGYWARAKLPVAIEWLKIALIPVPGDERVTGLLQNAKKLLTEIQML